MSHDGASRVSGPVPRPEYWISETYLEKNPEIAEALRKSFGPTFEWKHELAAIVLSPEQYSKIAPLMQLLEAAKREQSS